MSWQCPYCETVNQDAVPICTVCERVAPVVESFLSLEQIDHAREYEELLSEVYSFESEQDYDKMLQTALKAANTFSQNDTAISKVHLAIKLSTEKRVQEFILTKIQEHVDSTEFETAQTFIKLWHHLKFEKSIISSYAKIVDEEIDIGTHKATIHQQIFDSVLNGDFSEALTVIETEILKIGEAPELSDIRVKIQNLIKSFDSKEKPRKIHLPLKKSSEVPVATPEEKPKIDIKNKTQRKFPKVKRNK